MGYQLWTSPITGYRRRGTRLHELRSLFEAGITAHALLEPLQSCPADADAIAIRALLDQRDFDVAGIKKNKCDSVSGYVERTALTHGLAVDHAQDIPHRDIIADSTPLADLLAVLLERNHVFVMVGPAIRGIITRADLNKPALRVYLFGLISLFEMHLTFWIRNTYPNESWTNCISAGRLAKAKDLHGQRTQRNQDLPLVQCLQLIDKGTIIAKSQDVRERLGMADAKKAVRLFRKAEGFRNTLAHSQDHLAVGSTWEDTIALLLTIEAVVRASDQQVEEMAAKHAEQADHDELLGELL